LYHVPLTNRMTPDWMQIKPFCYAGEVDLCFSYGHLRSIVASLREIISYEICCLQIANEMLRRDATRDSLRLIPPRNDGKNNFLN